MSRIGLVVADVDGTLLTRDRVLTPRAVAAARALRRAGVRLTLTSGRPPRGMAMLIGPLALDAPIAAFNGGVFARPDLSILDSRPLAADIAASVAATVAHHRLDVWLYRDDEWLVTRPDAPHVAREQRTVRFAPRVVASLDGRFDGAVKIVGVSDDRDALSRCLADLHEHFPGEVAASRSQPYYLDVTHPDANKGAVVERMSRLLGVPLDRVATIGDMPNDVPMFRRSGVSIAMGQSSQDVKRQARYVTASRDDEGFARAMERWVLGERADPTGDWAR